MARLWAQRFSKLCLWAAAGLLAFFMGWATLFGLHVVQDPPPRPYPFPLLTILGLFVLGILLGIVAFALGRKHPAQGEREGRQKDNP